MLEARGDLFVPVDLSQLEQREHEVHETHHGIIAAIRSRDESLAAELMAAHIRLIQQLIDRALEAAGIPGPMSP